MFPCWMTFFSLDDLFMLDHIFGLKRNYGRTGDGPIFGSPSVALFVQGSSWTLWYDCLFLIRVNILMVNRYATCRLAWLNYCLRLCHVSKSHWLAVRIDLFFKKNATCQLLVGLCRFVDLPLGPINMYILSLTLYYSNNFLSAMSFKSLV